MFYTPKYSKTLSKSIDFCKQQYSVNEQTHLSILIRALDAVREKYSQPLIQWDKKPRG